MRDGKACRVCREPILRVPYVTRARQMVGRPDDCSVFYHLQCARKVNLLRPDELRAVKRVYVTGCPKCGLQVGVSYIRKHISRYHPGLGLGIKMEAA